MSKWKSTQKIVFGNGQNQIIIKFLHFANRESITNHEISESITRVLTNISNIVAEYLKLEMNLQGEEPIMP